MHFAILLSYIFDRASLMHRICRKTHLLHLLKIYVQFISDIILQRETLNENCSCKMVSMFACILCTISNKQWSKYQLHFNRNVTIFQKRFQFVRVTTEIFTLKEIDEIVKKTLRLGCS